MHTSRRTRDTMAPRWAAAVAGAVAVAVSLAILELLAGTTTAVASAVDAVAQQVIPRTPAPVTRWAIATFGTADIAVLRVGTCALALLVGAVTGLAARTRPAVAVAVFAAFALLGLVAASARSEVSVALQAAASAVAVMAGLATLHVSSTMAPLRQVGPEPDSWQRRRFLTATAALAGAAVLATVAGRAVLRGSRAVVDPRALSIPPPARALPAAPEDAGLAVAGLSPLFTPNDRFYVIDTAVAVPQVDPDGWSLRVHGMVHDELDLSYADLLARPLEEFDITLSCVSNEVGGDLVGNARWLGVRLADLLDEAGVAATAEQVLGRSTDGFTAGFPLAVARDGRDAIVAVGMNGEPLPPVHGFPARLVVPGLYGYVSATKWLTGIELTTWDVDGYWIPRGWAKRGPVKTQSRIDVPASGAEVVAGEVVAAGVAWAPTRGIDRVEVRVDDGPWREATTSAPLSADAWVQWRALVDVDPGLHRLQVRATDGTGRTQPATATRPAPDGAQGWHQVTFRAARAIGG